MKKFIAAILIAALVLTASSCSAPKTVPQLDTPDGVLEYMLEQNAQYVKTGKNSGDISKDRRADTAENGQHPYAVVITCSDSRAPAEHIFNAGTGEVFVIRTAGNVIGDFELGSVEYGAEHLGTPIVMVLGHTQCGAVDAALNGGAHGNIAKITDEINSCVPAGTEAREAERMNVQNSIARIMESEVMQHLTDEGACRLVGAIYDITTGEVQMIK